MMISFEDVALSLDVPTLLRDLGIGYIQKAGKQFRIECPNALHIDKNPSCFFHSETLIWHCFGCNAKGTVLDLIRQYKDIEDANTYLLKIANYINDGEAKTFKKRYKREKMKEFDISANYRRDFSQAVDSIQDFVERRKFNLELFGKYFIGFNNQLNSITIPIVYFRKVVNVGERFIAPVNPSKKIMYKKGSHLDACVWGIFEGYDNQTPIFCEGVFDAVRLREAGFNAFAALTNRLSDEKLRLLLKHFPLDDWCILPDNDAGGRQMLKDWLKVLHYRTIEVIKLERYKDADEAPVDDLTKMVFDNRKKLEAFDLDVKTKDQVCHSVRGKLC